MKLLTHLSLTSALGTAMDGSADGLYIHYRYFSFALFMVSLILLRREIGFITSHSSVYCIAQKSIACGLDFKDTRQTPSRSVGSIFISVPNCIVVLLRTKNVQIRFIPLFGTAPHFDQRILCSS